MTSNHTREENEAMESDISLVMDMKAGNKQALGKLVARHKKSAFRIALGMVGNTDDAHDISQEAFLRIYNSAHTFDEQQSFLPWFYTIIANLCRTWLKRRTVRDHRMVTLDDAPYLVADQSNPEGQYVARERIELLQKALLKLPFEEREIITLQHFRAMSYDEIANLLNIPKGTVMSRLYYARKKLATLMGPEDE